jgi:hypothetical protein
MRVEWHAYSPLRVTPAGGNGRFNQPTVAICGRYTTTNRHGPSRILHSQGPPAFIAGFPGGP